MCVYLRLIKFINDQESHVSDREISLYESYSINNDLVNEEDFEGSVDDIFSSILNKVEI